MEEKGRKSRVKECSAVQCSAVQDNHYTAFDKEVKSGTALGCVEPRLM